MRVGDLVKYTEECIERDEWEGTNGYPYIGVITRKRERGSDLTHDAYDVMWNDGYADRAEFEWAEDLEVVSESR